MNTLKIKDLLLVAIPSLALLACAPQPQQALIDSSNSMPESPIDNTPMQGPTPVAERIAILNTAWGTPLGNSPEYRAGLGNRAYRGPRQISKDQKCTDNYLGEWPYRVKQGLIPFAVAYRTPKMEKIYDGMGVYKFDAEQQIYTNIVTPHITFTAHEVRKLKVSPASGLKLPIERLNLKPDPRTGEEYLNDYFVIKHQNGVHDLDEIGRLTDVRLTRVEGMDPNEPPHLNETYVTVHDGVKKYLIDIFADKIDFRSGYYEAIPGQTVRHDDLAVKFVREGHKKMVVARETTDYNNYAIYTMGRGWIDYTLCMNDIEIGVDKDIQIHDIRQVGRNPEYNKLVVDLVAKHIKNIPEGEEVSILYTNYGMPWPGGNPKGIMSSPQPLAKETFHENGFNNYLSSKRYLMAAFDESQGGKWTLNFSKSGGTGGEESRTNSLYSYAMQGTNAVSFELDPLDFPNIRENLDIAVAKDKRKNIIIVTSHWFGDNEDTKVVIRDLNNMPYNSKEDFKNHHFWLSWCERYTEDGTVEQQRIEDTASCGEGWSRITLTDVFYKQIPDFDIAYAARIRGGVERYGVFPNLDIAVLAQGAITKDGGGTVEVTSGTLKGAKLMVRPDYKPGIPEDLTYYDVFKPKGRNKNVSEDAFRPFNEFTKPEDHAWSGWDDYDGYIGTQGLAKIGKSLTAPGNAVSDVVYFGPYRTLFNAPSQITLPFDKARVDDTSTIRARIYNDLTEEYDPVYSVPGGQPIRIDVEAGTATFDVQVLGNFVLVDEG